METKKEEALERKRQRVSTFVWLIATVISIAICAFLKIYVAMWVLVGMFILELILVIIEHEGDCFTSD